MSIVIVHGPQGSGKTRFAELLAKHYGCKRIVEAGETNGKPQEGDLVLTNDIPAIVPPGAIVIDIETALRDAGITPPEVAKAQFLADNLNPGDLYAGLILGEDDAPDHHLILLPGEAEKVTFKAASAWAKNAGGDLPTRREQALLYANRKSEFKPNWYWSGEQHAAHSGYAWHQYFDDGSQDFSDTSYEGRARAVRRLVI